jgi:hypothetical protein
VNAAETIAAAIKDLEQFQARAIRDGWDMHGNDLFGYVHRTIDAQLAILRAALALPHIRHEHVAQRSPILASVIALASAILGDS